MNDSIAQLGLWPEFTSAPPEPARIRRVGKSTALSPRRIDTSVEVALVLASGSSSKAQVLKNLGLRFTVDPANVDESKVMHLLPDLAVERLSKRKARAVAERHPGAITLGADTLAHIDGELLGKPRDRDDAQEMLRRLEGRGHEIVTAVTLIDRSSEVTKHARTQVRFRKCPLSMLARYVATGEPLGKAGSYAIQGAGAILIDSVEGEYTNVLGLPVRTFVDALYELGYALL